MVVTAYNTSQVLDPNRWGLPAEVVDSLADRLHDTWARYRLLFKTKTRDTSQLAFVYLRGILTMETNRNFANIARRVIDPQDDGQSMQQFMSDSPWVTQPIFGQIQSEITIRPELRGGMLTLDESGDKRAGDKSAGAARQYLGRLGKTDMGQVAVGLGYYKDGTWALVDAELYLPRNWLDQSHAQLRQRWHIPTDRTFATKPEIGLAMVKRAVANGLPFSTVGCASVYGASNEFRAALDREGLIYMADIPSTFQVYLEKPTVGVPQDPPDKRGRPNSRPRVLSEEQLVEVRSLTNLPDLALQPVTIRHTERGLLTYECAARRVWTVVGAPA